MNVLRPFVVAAAISIVLVACDNRQTTAVTADVEAPAIPQQTARVAYLTAVSGDVRVQSTAGLLEGDPGSRVDDGRLIIVSTYSQSDLQFGEDAFVRIYGPSEAVIRTLAGRTMRPVMEIELQSGSLAAYVPRLPEPDVFRVRSRRALYVVRGTRFHLHTHDIDQLVVDDGEVSVMPRSLDVPALLASSVADTGVQEALLAMDAASPSVSAGRRVQIDSSALEMSELLAVELSERLRHVESAAAADRSSLVEELIAVIRATADSLSRIVVSGVAGEDDDVAAKLASIEEVRFLPTPRNAQSRSMFDSGDSDSELVKFSLRTIPQNSRIYISGEYVGESVFRGVLRANQSLAIRVTKPGYRERRVHIDRARSELVTVQLERLPPSISAESFLRAIRADDVGTVRTYVQEGNSVNVRTEDGVPAVVLASGIVPVLGGHAPDLTYHREILRTIVAAGADLNSNFVVEGATFKLLHAAVLAGMAGFDVPALIELLVENGADVNAIIVLEGEELTPLAIAVRWALWTGETEEEIIRILLEARASLDVAISFNDQLITLREIAVQLIDQGEIDDPQLIRLLRLAGAAG
jgi:hypothetical protein